MFCIRDADKRKNSHFNSVDLGFYFGGEPNPADKLPILQEQLQHTSITSVQVRPASQIFEIAGHYHQFHQVFCEMDFAAIQHAFFSVSEYEVRWPREPAGRGDPSAYAIDLVNSKILMPRKSTAHVRGLTFLPDYSQKYEILGAVMSWEGGRCLRIPRSEHFKMNNEVVLTNYFEYYDIGETHQMMCLMAEAQITTKLKQNLTNSERYRVLENALRAVWNMVPDDGFKDAR
jgi:hypothetical protein